MKLQLPGGRVVELELKGEKRRANAPDCLFRGARDLLGANLDVDALVLAEFHALRAIATHLGCLEEEEIELECRNCDHAMKVFPCASMPLAPFADAELDDPELDELLDLDVAHDVTPLETTIRFRKLTAAEALPLHRALAKGDLHVTAKIVLAMGIAALGDETDPAVIARALTRCDDRAFGTITNLFLTAHYPLRLFAPAICEACGTRNDVDAPYDREFPPYEEEREATAEKFPTFDEFDALAKRIAEPMIAEAPGPRVTLVVDGEVPACDDGGEPLLGSYVPGHEGDAQSPMIYGELTIYYHTFAAMFEEDGPYDVAAEIEETIEHELEHHVASLIGHDPKDDEERDEIAREAQRVLGKKALARASASAFGADVGEFVRRTWLIWVVALIAGIIAVLASR